MRNADISRAYEMRGRETAYRTVSTEIERDYRDNKIDLSEKHRLDAENHRHYINTPDPEEERARNEQSKKFDFSKPIKTRDVRELEFWAHWYASYGKHTFDETIPARFLTIFGCVFRWDPNIEKWRFDHAER